MSMFFYHQNHSCLRASLRKGKSSDNCPRCQQTDVRILNCLVFAEYIFWNRWMNFEISSEILVGSLMVPTACTIVHLFQEWTLRLLSLLRSKVDYAQCRQLITRTTQFPLTDFQDCVLNTKRMHIFVIALRHLQNSFTVLKNSQDVLPPLYYTHPDRNQSQRDQRHHHVCPTPIASLDNVLSMSRVLLHCQ